MCDFESKEPMDFSKILHFEGQHEEVFLHLEQRGIVRKHHKIVHVQGNDAKLSALRIDKDSMIRVTTGESEFHQLLFCLHVPCPWGLFKAI